ncbi:MAG: sigma-70 family RNA polymerase sigma factor [Acidobacteria bacterium]|nr:sigma-70 family RNA polymerase sigma factor [Acidobacteriota bacterium]
MAEPSSDQITELLHAWSRGEPQALDKLAPLVHKELHRVAHKYMRLQRPGHTLQTTALIHEAFLKLVKRPKKDWQSRAHFFGVAAQAMRHILVDYARHQQTAKRGHAFQMISLDEGAVISVERCSELVALDEAMNKLAEFDARKSRVVEMRFFAGLSFEEIAEVLGISPDTVMRDWRLAKAWLRRKLSNSEGVLSDG